MASKGEKKKDEIHRFWESSEYVWSTWESNSFANSDPWGGSLNRFGIGSWSQSSMIQDSLFCSMATQDHTRVLQVIWRVTSPMIFCVWCESMWYQHVQPYNILKQIWARETVVGKLVRFAITQNTSGETWGLQIPFRLATIRTPEQQIFILLDCTSVTDLSSGCDFCAVRLNFDTREVRVECHKRNAALQTLFVQPNCR